MNSDLCIGSSTSTNLSKYDVFINFRGEDTRKNFTDHLYKALCHKQIKVFIDEKSLGKGEEISSTLLQAIQSSKIALIVFSENYASSTWCLDELVHILKCKEENGQIVVPIFYGVDPSHVRKQEGSFARAFVAHQPHFEDGREKLHEWKATLKRACGISGWDARNRYESELIEEIVEHVASMLRYTSSRTTAYTSSHTTAFTSSLTTASSSSRTAAYTASRPTASFEGLVGIARQLQKLESLLHVGSPDVRILGICGKGGIGKTTLAGVVFDRFYSQFEGRCFLKNIREESKRHGLTYVGYKLYSKLLEEEDINIVNQFVKYRIRRRKVLIVLDDVDDLEQIERLAGHHSRFGSGSRIIITTRRRHLLRFCGVDEIYEVDGLEIDEALELFSMNAFRRRRFVPDYARFSLLVVQHTRGIPLALIVFGSFLRGLSTEEWESVLDKLKITSPNDVKHVFRMSCNDLDQMEKAIFVMSCNDLDEMEKAIFVEIACFLKEKGKDFVERILEEFGSDARAGIEALVDKSLISISIEDDEIYMHDSIQEMAWEIVHHSTNKLEKNFKSSFNKGIGAQGDISNIDNEELMPRGTVSEKRYQGCKDYPQKFLPSKISPHNLVELDMPSNKLNQFWNEAQDTTSSTTVGILISYEGQWRTTQGCWSFNGQKAKGMIVSKNITYDELVERLRHSLMVDESQYDLDMRFLVDSGIPMAPVEIQNNEDVNFFISETSSKGNPRYPLCITLLKKDVGQGRDLARLVLQWGCTLYSLLFLEKQIT